MWVKHVLLFTFVTCCSGACTYPSDLIGEWYSTSFGTLTFSSTTFSGFSSALSATQLTFTCELSSGSQYVSKTPVQLFQGVLLDVYLCMNLVKISDIKYFFTLDSNRDSGTGIRFYTASSTANVTLADACTYTDARTGGEFELLILKANISDAFVTCPGHLHSLFDVFMTTQSVSNCNGTSMDGRSTTALTFTYASCANGQLNAGGYLTCLYSVSSGYTYVSVYNNDTAVDRTSTFRFTCFALAKDDATLLATESPGSCDGTQTPTSVDSPGVTYFMTDLLYEGSEKSYTVIIIAVVCSVVFVIIVIIAIVVYFKVCRKPKPEPPQKPPRKRKRKASVTDYTPRLSRAGSVEKDLHVKKKSTGEILTGTLNDKKHAVIDGGAYVPPLKKEWQRTWETKMRPPTPIWSSQRGSTPFPGLEKGPKSSSLPENLHKKLDMKIGTESGTSASLDNLAYSERVHALSKMPQSTGKFGNSPRPMVQESLTSGLDTTLETIKENPLSRENTVADYNKTAPETWRTADMASSVQTDNRSVLSTAMTSSTLSAREIHLTPFSNLSRSSRMSASSASIFDDPTWLNENMKKTDSFFDVLKNLIPGLPKKQAKDQNWFTKSHSKPEITREDIEYFRNRTKRSVGINGLDKSVSQTSLVATEKKKRLGINRRTKIQPKIDWQYKWEHFLRPKSPFTAFFRRRTKLRELKSAPPRIRTRSNVGEDTPKPVDCTSVDIPGTVPPRIEITLDEASSAGNVSDQDCYPEIPRKYGKIPNTAEWQETQSLNIELSQGHKQARKRDFTEAFQLSKPIETQSRESLRSARMNENDEKDTVSVKSGTYFTVIDETDMTDAASLSAESDHDLDQYIIECLSDTSSIQSDRVYTDDWILGEEEYMRSREILKRGSKYLSRTRNRESKRELNDWFSTEWGIGKKT